MNYIVQDSEGKKMIMSMASSMPLPLGAWNGFEILGKVEDFPDLMSEIEAQSLSEKEKAEAKQFLNDTDWKVIRHRDQLEMNMTTSMTSEEFDQLLIDRQMARNKI
jgi:hypothetical protein